MTAVKAEIFVFKLFTFLDEEDPPHLHQYAHLVSLTVDWVPQLSGGEEHPQVVKQNGLLSNTTQGKVLKKPGTDQNTAVSEQS